MKLRFLSAFILFVSVFVSFAQDEELAMLYARYAHNAYLNDKYSDFQELTAKGLEYDDKNPDLLCFQGILHWETRNYAEAEQFFSKAFYSGHQGEQLDLSTVLSHLFEARYRLGMDESIRTLFYSIGEFSRDDGDVFFYTVLALIRMNEFEQAVSLAEEAVYRYQDQRFLILLSAWTEGLKYPGILSEYISRQGLLYPDLLSRVVLEPGIYNSKVLATLYTEQANDINSWYFKQKILGFPQVSYPELIDSPRVWPLLSLQSFLEEYPGLYDFMRKLDVFHLDINHDGISDFIISQKNDQLVWDLDPDQDGIVNSELVWDKDDRLVSLKLHKAGVETKYHYYEYPYIDRISIQSEDRNEREYHYLPGSYHLVLSEKDNLSLEIIQNPEIVKISFKESEFLKHCFSLIDSVTEPRHQPFREYTVVDSDIRRFREDSNFDGTFDRVVLVKNWLPYEGYRDLNGNGEYDLKEKYIDGRLAGFEFSGPDGRLEEYRDLWDKQRYQLWDFTMDGFYDALLKKDSRGVWSTIILGNQD